MLNFAEKNGLITKKKHKNLVSRIQKKILKRVLWYCILKQKTEAINYIYYLNIYIRKYNKKLFRHFYEIFSF